MRTRSLVLIALALAGPVRAQDFTVTTGWDFVDPRIDGTCGYAPPPDPVTGEPRPPFCSLRAAIQEANANPAELHRIFLGPGLHFLWVRGSGEDAYSRRCNSR